jgi:hypothetical protein
VTTVTVAGWSVYGEDLSAFAICAAAHGPEGWHERPWDAGRSGAGAVMLGG